MVESHEILPRSFFPTFKQKKVSYLVCIWDTIITGKMQSLTIVICVFYNFDILIVTI